MFVNIKLFCFKYEYDLFLLCYFVICQKYLWIVEIPCPYFKVISKRDCYLLLIGNLIFISRLKVSIFIAVKWNKRWQFQSEIAFITSFKNQNRFHYNMKRALYLLFRRKNDSFQLNFKRSFTGNLRVSRILDVHFIRNSYHSSSLWFNQHKLLLDAKEYKINTF